MPKLLRYVFLIHAIVALVVGALLLVIPGRVLQWVGWVATPPVSGSWAAAGPIVTRLLGAGLLALAWGSFRGWRAADRREVTFLVEMGAAFTILGCVGLLRHLLFAGYPFTVWLSFAVLAAFAIAWVVSWFLLRK